MYEWRGLNVVEFLVCFVFFFQCQKGKFHFIWSPLEARWWKINGICIVRNVNWAAVAPPEKAKQNIFLFWNSHSNRKLHITFRTWMTWMMLKYNLKIVYIWTTYLIKNYVNCKTLMTLTNEILWKNVWHSIARTHTHTHALRISIELTLLLFFTWTPSP